MNKIKKEIEKIACPFCGQGTFRQVEEPDDDLFRDLKERAPKGAELVAHYRSECPVQKGQAKR